MSHKELLKTIQNDIKNIDTCIEMCDTEEGVDYLKSIQQNLREQEIKLVKKMSIEKAIKEHINDWIYVSFLHDVIVIIIHNNVLRNNNWYC